MLEQSIIDLLGEDAENLLQYTATAIPKEQLHAPGPDFIDRIFLQTNRSIPNFEELSYSF